MYKFYTAVVMRACACARLRYAKNDHQHTDEQKASKALFINELFNSLIHSSACFIPCNLLIINDLANSP